MDMTPAAARTIAAAELRTAASIRRDIAALRKGSSYRRGAIDAHRDCIRTARYARLCDQLLRAV